MIRRLLAAGVLLMAGCSASSPSSDAPPANAETTVVSTTVVPTAPVPTKVSAEVASTTTIATSTKPATSADVSTTSADVSGTSPSTTLPAVAGTDAAGGVGDALFPGLGNAGIDVTHIDLALSWSPADHALTATATLDITALSPLASFHLDFSGFDLDEVVVNDRSAGASRTGGELIVTPTATLGTGPFHVRIRYHGIPEPGADTVGRPLGWLSTASGGAYTLAEPGGAHYWFPSNDHPSDKATYTLHIEVPEPLVAVGNGQLVSTTATRSRRTYTYAAAEPMASYLVLVAIDRYRIVERNSPSGLPLRSVEPSSWTTPGEYLDVTGEMLDFFSNRFGPYPFASYGLLFADSVRNLAMETQTISLFSAADMHGVRGDDESFLAHELAHQWFGDAVSPIRWNDVWLNESFATYAEWLWTFRDDPQSLDRLAEANRRSSVGDRDRGTTGHPNGANLFGRQVYNGGAIVLHALRREVGDDTFFAILQTWFTRFRYKSAGTEDFTAVASEVAQHDLGPFLSVWLDGATLPPFGTPIS